MKTIHTPVCAALGLALALTLPGAQAQDEEALATFRVMKPEVAMKLARKALETCRAEGFQVAVAVVDRFGVLQVLIRDQLAGPHTPDTARRKAWTAVSFRADTLEMAEVTQAGKPQSAARNIAEALMLGGGIPVTAEGAIVGAVGVSGAPGGPEDHKCGQAGIEAIEEDLSF